MAASRPTWHILVVEDEPTIREMLQMLFEMEGFEVTAVNNGRAALAALDASKPDLVLTDNMMPYMSGTDLLRHIRSDPAHADIPAILMSAGSVDADAAELADLFIAKPVGIDELLAAARALLPPPSETG